MEQSNQSAIQNRIRAILVAEANAIAAVIVDDAFTRAIDALEKCTGKIVTVGIGKAGYSARNFAALLCSTGTPAFFVDPGEAGHGDVGAIGQGDCIVAFSSSGETPEVLEMLKHSRPLGCSEIIAITSRQISTLRKEADIILDMGIIEEPCQLKLTPTASTAVMGAIGDSLALVLMERKGMTKNDYFRRHYGGYIGTLARNSSN